MTAANSSAQDPHRWRAQSWNSSGLFRLIEELIGRLPEDFSEQLGELLAHWAGWLLPGTLKALRANIEGVRPGLPAAEYEILARRTLVQYSLGVKDYLLQSSDRLQKFEMTGEPSQGVRDLMAQGKGFLIVSAHYGNFELGSYMLQKHNMQAAIIALPEEVAAIDAMRVRNRQAFGVETLPVGSELDTFLAAKRHLAQGRALAMLVDRQLPKNGIPVNWFGKRCLFLRTPAQLARHSGAPLVPVSVTRLGQSRYRMDCGEPVIVPGTRNESDLVDAMQQVADFFAARISRHPDQWFNFYDYFAAAGDPGAGG